VKQASKADLAQAFIDEVTGESGQKVLNAAGFAKP
jgi:ABC-type molybdate transport system substrate-binding protein